MTTTTPPCSNFGSKGSTLKLLPGLADCEKIKWITLPLWVILRLSRNIQYTVQQQQMHFWCTIISIEILHSGTKISTVISNLRLCFVFVCWITSAHYSQVLIWSPRFLLAHSSASVGCVSAACGTLKGKRPHLQRNADETDPQKYWQGVGMVRRYVLDLLLILFIFSSSEYDQEFNRLRWEEE